MSHADVEFCCGMIADVITMALTDMVVNYCILIED